MTHSYIQVFKHHSSLVGFTLILVLFGIIFFFNISNVYATEAKQVDKTAKIVFSRDVQGVLQALVIPHTAEGSFTRSGWILCRIEASYLREEYERRLGDNERLEGYFRVRYRVTSKDSSLPVLQFLGVIDDISPWQPSFLSK